MSVDISHHIDLSADDGGLSVSSHTEVSVTSQSNGADSAAQDEEQAWNDEHSNQTQTTSSQDGDGGIALSHFEDDDSSDGGPSSVDPGDGDDDAGDDDDGGPTSPGTGGFSEHQEEADDAPSRSFSDSSDTSSTFAWSPNGDDERDSFNTSQNDVAGALQSLGDDDESGGSDWPRNENGEYLVITIDIRPGADIDLTTVFDVDINKLGSQLDFDQLVLQLAQIQENTYIDVDFSWGRKPDVVVTVEEDFDIDNDIHSDVDFDPDDVTLDSIIDIIQHATPVTDVSVGVDMDADDSDGDGEVVELDIDVELDVGVLQDLYAFLDVTSP